MIETQVLMTDSNFSGFFFLGASLFNARLEGMGVVGVGCFSGSEVSFLSGGRALVLIGGGGGGGLFKKKLGWASPPPIQET